MGIPVSSVSGMCVWAYMSGYLKVSHPCVHPFLVRLLHRRNCAPSLCIQPSVNSGRSSIEWALIVWHPLLAVLGNSIHNMFAQKNQHLMTLSYVQFVTL
jgi:hypothetical protein